MQAMVLVDNYRLLCDVDALLGTDGIAQLAADAAFPHIVDRCFLCFSSNGEAVPDDVCRVTDVKILAIRFIQAEHL